MKNFVLVLCFVLAVSALTLAQGLGSIAGTVTDPQGAVIASAQVKATEAGTGLSRSTTSDAQGYYVISSLRPAEYTITVEASGFRKFTQSKVTLLADQALTLNPKMTIGSQTEVVEVTGNAVQVDTSTSTMKQVIETQRITELPLNGRNAAELSLLVAGAVNSPSNQNNPTGTFAGGALQGATKTFPGAVAISVNGSRQNQVTYQLDGGNNVDEYTNVNQPFPNPDALQEFSVQTSNFSAEYGQNAGGVVNIITKSGTNSLHGNLFEYVRNSVFNAKSWQSTTGRDKLHRNQFGGTVGGPIIHDRTFFFAAYQGTVLTNVAQGLSGTVPTAAQRATATDPAIINLLKGIPIGDPVTNKVAFTRPDQQDFKEVTGKVDHSFNKDDRLTVRYFYDRFTRNAVFDPANFLSYSDGSTIVSQNVMIHENHIFTSHLLNDFRVSYARDAAGRGPAANAISVQDLGVNIPFQPTPKAIQQIRVSGAFNFGDNPTARFVRNNFTWSDDVSWVLGKHDLHMGGVIERSLVDLDNKFFQPAEFSFPSMTAFLAGQLGDFSGNFAFRQGAGEFKNNRNTFAGIYIQDNYHITRRLTLNLGLRYEPALPWREAKGRVQQFRIPGLIANVRSVKFPNAPPGVYFPGDTGVPEDGVRASLNNFAPRVGFAYDVFGDGSTSVRGGAGIFYDTRIPGIINNRFVDQTPFSPQLIFSTVGGGVKPGSFFDPLCIQAATQVARGCTPQANLFPAPFPPPSTSTFALSGLYLSWDPNHKYQVPTLYNWNLALEHQFPMSILARAAYVGSRSNHLTETLNLDPAPVSPTATVGILRLNAIAASLGLPNNTFSQVQQDMQDINSTYHSLQLSLERRSRVLTILGNYTWSKSIDDLPVGAGVTGFDTFSARPWDDPLRHQFDRGASEFDHTHRFVASYIWALPSLKETNTVIHTVFGDWQLSGLVSAQTGRPFTSLAGTELSGTGLGQDRASLLSGANPYGLGACPAGSTKPCKSLLNPAAFVPLQNPLNPAQKNPVLVGTFGNVSKGSLRFPGFFGWDMGLAKSFSFTERYKLQFRAEFFNVFNRVNFDESVLNGAGGNFARQSSTNNFGAIVQANDPRIGQLALKLSF